MEKEASSSSINNVPDYFSSLKPEDLIRGETPDNIETKCVELCKLYIGGSWALVNKKQDYTVSRIVGGLTNQLYRVKLAHTIPLNDTLCGDVAIKFFQSKLIENFDSNENERLNDFIITTILSAMNIGPKVYGIFDEGMVFKFYENEEFGTKHQNNDFLVKKLVKTLSAFHHLDVPIRKDGLKTWFNQNETCLKIAYNELNVQSLIEELQLPLLLNHDPRVEFQKLKTLILSLNSPTVFCHNDFRGSNFLVNKADQNIVLIDAEYSAYGLRAHDIGGYIVEWGHEPFDIEKHDLPSEDVLNYFVQLYIDACEEQNPGYAAKPENSLAVIVKEVKIMTLGKYMFFLGIFLKSTKSFVSTVKFDQIENMKYCEFVYSKYFKIKKRLIEEQIISE